MITDSDGDAVKNMTYDSFGNIVGETGSAAAEEISYTGRDRESEFGLYYYRARYYDPLTGRFISRDPLGFGAGDVILYRYVGNNPISFIDPFGWWRWPVNGPVTITSGFGKRVHPITGKIKRHGGIDISLALGQPALAAHEGTVVDVVVGDKEDAGYVKIKHADGSHTVYVHVKPCVKKWQRVAEGQVIAVSDASGQVTGPHLHFGYQPPNTEWGTRSNPLEILPPLNPSETSDRPRISILSGLAGQGYE